MDVAVDESGHHQLPIAVDDARVLYARTKLGARTHGDDAIVLDEERLRPGRIGVSRPDARAENGESGRGTAASAPGGEQEDERRKC